MGFVEFIEATCRIADKLSIPNIVDETVQPEDWLNPAKARVWAQKTLAEKIEAYLLILADRLLPKKFQEENLKYLAALKELDNIYSNDMEVPGNLGKVTQTLKQLQEASELKKIMLG